MGNFEENGCYYTILLENNIFDVESIIRFLISYNAMTHVCEYVTNQLKTHYIVKLPV